MKSTRVGCTFMVFPTKPTSKPRREGGENGAKHHLGEVFHQRVEFV